MLNRNQRVALAQETLTVLENAAYTNPSNRRVSFSKDFEKAKAESVHYQSDSFAELFAQRDKFLAFSPKIDTIFEVSAESSLEALERLSADTEKLFCLNFASAKNPGGGFLSGSQAQEESLARSSALYPCIAQMTQMYDKNRAFKSCFYTDDMIYSPQVPVLRRDEGEFLETPYLVSFLTAPAVNVGAIKNPNLEDVETAMLERLEKILSLAYVKDYKTLVLGAWGCGVFQNNPNHVAGYFQKQLKTGGMFEGRFEKIVFAVYSPNGNTTNLEPFRKIFG